MLIFLKIGFVIILIVLYMLWKYTYWWRNGGVKFLRPSSLLFGNFASTFLLKKSLGVRAGELYQQTDAPFFGTYVLLRPALILRDVKIIRNVLIKDFQHFVSRGFHVDESYDPVSGNLFVIDDAIKWKLIRQKLTPAFTTSKLKTMYNVMCRSGDLVENYLLKFPEGSVLEMTELAAQYSTNIIISMTYGIEIDCFNNEKDKMFHSIGKGILGPSRSSTIRILIKWLSPTLSKLTKLQIIDPKLKVFMFDLFNQMLKLRQQGDMRRDDFLQVLTDLKNNDTTKEYTMNELAAQGIIIFIAGYDTTSIAISHSLYEIAKNPAIQDTIHEEIDTVMAKYDNVLSYECLQEMKFLDCCIDEALRMYPSLPMLNRQCFKDYKIPDTDFTIEKGTAVIIPILALHRDPKYFSEPDKFNPYRFVNEPGTLNIKNDPNIPYFPFGDGPRNCIGLRMGKLMVKIGLVRILSKFRYHLEMDANKPLEFMALNLTLFPGNGVHLRINRR